MDIDVSLDLTFHALADGTRRAMLGTLNEGRPRSASELGRQFQSAQPTISKHLSVLEKAGLVERHIVGRQHLFRLREEPLNEAIGWIGRHRTFWKGAVDQLEIVLKSDG